MRGTPRPILIVAGKARASRRLDRERHTPMRPGWARGAVPAEGRQWLCHLSSKGSERRLGLLPKREHRCQTTSPAWPTNPGRRARDCRGGRFLNLAESGRRQSETFGYRPTDPKGSAPQNPCVDRHSQTTPIAILGWASLLGRCPTNSLSDTLVVTRFHRIINPTRLFVGKTSWNSVA